MKTTLTCLMALMMGATMQAQATADTISLSRAVVTGSRTATDPRHLPMTITTLSRERLTADFHTSALPTVSEQVPGMFVTSRGILGYGVSTGAAGTMKIRGVGGMAQMLVLIDGLPQYAGLYGHPIPDAYVTNLAERVEILRGPASLLYGSNAMGGVMNIVSRQRSTDGVQGNSSVGWGSYGSLEGQANLLFRAGKLSGSAGFTEQHTDGHRPNSKFEENAGFLKLAYDFTPHWTLSGMGNLAWFNSSNPGPESAPLIDNDMRILRGIASLNLTNQYQRTSGALRSYISWGHHHINDGYTASSSPRTSLYLHNDLQLGVSAYQSYALFDGNMTTIGADWQHFGGHAWNRAIATGAETDIADRTEDDLAAYADFRQQIIPLLSVDAGLRVDHHTKAGTELVPQGGIILHLPQQAEVRAMVSKGFRNPTLREMYMFPPQNEELRQERMMNYELSYKQPLMHNRLHVGANLFLLRADNLIATQMVGGSPLNVNTDKVHNWGFELESAYKAAHNLELRANYSFLHMKEKLLAAPENKLYVGASWQPGRWGLNTGLQYISGLYTNISAAQQKKEEFLLWNLTASYRIIEGARIFARGENLLAQKYEINAGFPMPRMTFMAGLSVDF